MTKIKIHWKSRLNTSFDAEFNALKQYLILTEKIDLENREKNQKTKLDVTHSQRIPHIWRVFFKIKIHWKNRLNRSFDAEFNALPDYGIIIEKIDLENGEKKMDLHIQREFFIFDEFLCELKPIAKKVFSTSFDREFNARKEYIILIERIDLENWEEKVKEDGMWHIEKQFLIFDEFLFKIKIHLKNRLT